MTQIKKINNNNNFLLKFKYGRYLVKQLEHDC